MAVDTTTTGPAHDLVPLKADFFTRVPAAAAETNRQLPADATAAPVIPDLSPMLPVEDVSPGVGTDTQTYGTFVIDQPTAGIAFGGFLPPGAMCLLVPMARRAELVKLASQKSLATDLATLATRGPTAPRSGVVSNNFPQGSILLRPGEAVSFGRRVTGLAGVFFNAWGTNFQSLTVGYQGLTPAVYPGTTPYGVQWNSLMNDFGVYGPAFRPYMRLFAEAGAVPREIAYTKVPYTASFIPMSTLTGATEGNLMNSVAIDLLGAPGNPFVAASTNGRCAIPPGTKHVTVGITATNGPTVPKLAGTSAPEIHSLSDAGAITGTADLRLYWILSTACLHMNPGDHWNPGGRGAASATHSVEVYDVPNNAVGLQVWCGNMAAFTGAGFGGTWPWVTVTCTED